ISGRFAATDSRKQHLQGRGEIMFCLKLGQHVKIILAALATLALTVGTSSSQVPTVVINFDELPNEGGIHLTGCADATVSGEVFHISSPAVPSGYSPDAICNHIGISQTSSGYLVDILESPGGPISDQVHIYQFVTQYTVIDFISDENQFVTGVPNAIVVETGN